MINNYVGNAMTYYVMIVKVVYVYQYKYVKNVEIDYAKNVINN